MLFYKEAFKEVFILYKEKHRVQQLLFIRRFSINYRVEEVFLGTIMLEAKRGGAPLSHAYRS
jgi:hypothetical protein